LISAHDPRPYVSYGPGHCGDHDTEEEARACVEACGGEGAVYVLLSELERLRIKYAVTHDHKERGWEEAARLASERDALLAALEVLLPLACAGEDCNGERLARFDAAVARAATAVARARGGTDAR
jgi:hypothetical protein